MVRYYFIGFLLLTAQILRAQAFHIMTYNVRLDVATDGDHAWPNRKEKLCDLMRFHGPDVFGLQEALPHQLDYIAERFPDFEQTGIGREGVGKGEASCLFFRKDRFQVIESSTFWLSPTPDSISMGWDAACLRVCTWAMVKDRRTDSLYCFANTHLDHLGVVARKKSIELILSRLQKLTANSNCPLIFMGDLNAEPDSEVINDIRKVLVDCRNTSALVYGTEGTFNGFAYDKQDLRRIDYIFLSPEVFEVERYGVLNDAFSQHYPSDHFPVLVTIKHVAKEKQSPKTVQTLTTTPHGTERLKTNSLGFSQQIDSDFPVILIDTSQRFQTMDGFGFTLTGGSAMLLAQMPPAARQTLLYDLFGTRPDQTAVSYLRLSMGASDLDPFVFSYHDTPADIGDLRLPNFSLSRDTLFLIPILKEILAINSQIKLMATPWSPPAWMKTNGKTMGGSLKADCYAVYAQYFVKYLKAMAAYGIEIEAVTIQNEPEHGGNQPSMLMTALEQADFIKNQLGPALQAAQLKTKIIIWDHNCDHPEYPIAILNDPEAKRWIDGTAFHMYGGNEQALNTVHTAHPDKNLYFTEQWTSSEGSYADDLHWHVKHVLIGTCRNWSKTVLEWNLASDPNHSIHTIGGCTQCKGAITIHGTDASYNVAHDVIAHASRFVRPGSVRIGSTSLSQVENVCFLSPDGQKACIILNSSNQNQTVNLSDSKNVITLNLPARGVVSVKW